MYFVLHCDYIMEYYNSKYPRITIEHLPGIRCKITMPYSKCEFITPYTDSNDYVVDIIFKDNKFYKLSKTKWTIKDDHELSELINFLTIKGGFVLDSSRLNKVVLKSLDYDDSVYISTHNKVRLVEYVQIELA